MMMMMMMINQVLVENCLQEIWPTKNGHNIYGKFLQKGKLKISHDGGPLHPGKSFHTRV